MQNKQGTDIITVGAHVRVEDDIERRFGGLTYVPRREVPYGYQQNNATQRIHVIPHLSMQPMVRVRIFLFLSRKNLFVLAVESS
jgi:hypothetical protein